MSKKYTEDMLWPEWTDVLGNTYKPGDIVAVATISGRSPQMVFARVIRINRVNSSGEPHMVNKSFELEEPIRKERECYYVQRSKDPYYRRDYYSYDRMSQHVCEPSCTEYWVTHETRKVPSCTVTAEPLIDGRNFGRWSTDQDGKNKAVTYSIPGNIVLVEKGNL